MFYYLHYCNRDSKASKEGGRVGKKYMCGKYIIKIKIKINMNIKIIILYIYISVCI